MPGMNRRQLLQSALATSTRAFVPATFMQAYAAIQPGRFRAVREYVLRAIGQGRATGVSIAVVHAGQIAWTEGFGLSNREHNIAATPDTPFSLASITKPFTAMLTTTLAAEGLIALDAPAMHYLQTTPLRGPNGDPNAITVRMLGAHISGLPGTFAAYLADAPVIAPSTDAFLHDYGRLAYPPGQIYEYSNIGFEALGAIVSGLTREPLGTAMEKRVLKPLGMSSTFFSNAKERISSAAIGYDAKNKKIAYYTTSTPPSGELYASARDLVRFALFNLGKPIPGVHSVPSERWLRELHAPAFIGPRGIATTFGWFMGKLQSGAPYLFKGGGQPGVAAKIFVLPSADLACIVLTNRTDAMPLVEECSKQIIDSYVPGFSIPEEDAGPGLITFAAAADYVGSWKGRLRNAGADQPVSFTLSADGTATLALSGRSPQPVVHLQSQAPGFEGTTNGLIDCTDGAAFGSRILVLKLISHEGKLCGRVTARGTRPGLLLANLPYVLTLERV